jgi:hypothetical protein
LIEELSEKLGEKVDSKALMKDILNDVAIESLEKLKSATDKKGTEIKHREGCSYLQIKDSKRKKPMNLPIRK